MKYQVFGPFEIPRTRRGLISADKAEHGIFWKSVVSSAIAGLPYGCGCYVFALKTRRGLYPWYVGMTEKRTFKAESLDYHKLARYNEVLAEKVGIPILILIAKKTNTGRFAKPSKGKQHDIRFLETYLIGHALNRNRSLVNQKKTKFLKSLLVPGVLNSRRGRPNEAVSALCRLLDL